jgi:hypothetical protein
MAAYVPPGWPAGVHPPGSEEFEQTAVTWLLDVVPPDYRLHGVLRRHPLALAVLARHHLAACVQAARDGYRGARTELASLPPGGVDAVLEVYRSEGRRLVETARAVDLVGRALRGEAFTPQLGTQRRGAPPRAAARTPAPPREASPPREATPREASPPREATTPEAVPAQPGPREAITREATPREASPPREATPPEAVPAQPGPREADPPREAASQETGPRRAPARGAAPRKGGARKGGAGEEAARKGGAGEEAARKGTAGEEATREAAARGGVAAQKGRDAGRRAVKSGRPR